MEVLSFILIYSSNPKEDFIAFKIRAANIFLYFENLFLVNFNQALNFKIFDSVERFQISVNITIIGSYFIFNAAQTQGSAIYINLAMDHATQAVVYVQNLILSTTLLGNMEVQFTSFPNICKHYGTII